MALTLALVGCTKKETPAPETNNPAPQVDTAKDKVVMVTDMGGLNDRSFNESSWEGLDKTFRAEYGSKGVTVQALESKTQDDYTPNLTAAVNGGSDMTWAIGYMMADALEKDAGQFPGQHFGIIDSGAPAENAKSNVAYVSFKEEEGSFLVGVVAGLMTKSNKVGFVGGMSGDLIKKFEVGYRAGVLTVNPKAEILVQYAESWTDDAKGETIATTMYNQGADVIYAAAGNCGQGVARAATKKGAGFWFIGVDKDQYDLAPANTLTSMMKRVDVATYSITKAWYDGTFPGGKTTILGLAEDGVGLAPSSNKNTPQDVVDKANSYGAKIKAGEITVPSTEATLTTYVAGLK
jgi:basic membrane protein A